MFRLIINRSKALFLAAAFLVVTSSTSFAQQVAAHLDAVPPGYNGECPATITFSGWIGLNHPGTVRYRFTRSDGARGPFTTLKFEEAGRQNVGTTWRLGGARLRQYTGWEAIQIVYPDQIVSNRARFHMNCGK
jgi:hypothetical protein